MADTWELRINRLRQELRKGQGFARTVSAYQVFHDGKAVSGLSGFFVERQGPGDNSDQGRINHRRIAAGRYSLETHSGEDAPGTNTPKYQTIGYSKSVQTNGYPRPSIGFADSTTGARRGILIHPGQNYCWSIGCFNPGANLNTADDNLSYKEGYAMVVALIDDVKVFFGNSFPKSNNRPISGAVAIITGEPK
jgi:hypothetical protein